MKLTLNSSILHTSILNKKGQLINGYAPFYNLCNEDQCISDCSTSGETGLNFSMCHPVDMLVQESYDGGVNLILNDGKNIPKIVNSRFSVQEDNTFQITDRIGFKDANLYDKNKFAVQSSLLPHVEEILHIQYGGLLENTGTLKCGVYTFYFKYADQDNNMTAVQGESGLVYCHKGQINSPSSIRFGLENESTDKAVKFTLSNIDLGYTKVYVYYSRVYGNEYGRGTEVYKITIPYSVQTDGTCEIIVTGSEVAIQTSPAEIQETFADLGSVETQATFSGMLLQGNITTSEHDWDELKQISWRIYPSFGNLSAGSVGSLNNQYEDPTHSDETKCVYYNSKNLYHRVGYWPEEIYRFGIVYIFEDGSVSPVLDVLGIDFTKKPKIESKDLYNQINQLDGTTLYEDRIYEPSDGQFTDELNSKGVIRFPNKRVLYYENGSLVPQPLYIQFHLDKIGHTKRLGEVSQAEIFKKHKIKGYFFVRQVRVPNILCQGLILQQTDQDRGGLPCLKQNSSILGQSFLDSNRYISHDGYFKAPDIFKPQSMLAPDAILQTPMFNDIFGSGKFVLKPVYQCANSRYIDGDYTFQAISVSSESFTTPMKIINIPDGAPMLTNGKDYFSGIAGDPGEPTNTSDMRYVWKYTLPQTLSISTSLVRGIWGTYAGLEESDSLKYGQLCNVYTESWEHPEVQVSTMMYNAKHNNEPYYAVCDRQDKQQSSVKCFRGDCFISLYTHRMFRNFVDEDRPTNTEIVDISSWQKNYAVRCTAYKSLNVIDASYSNCAKENEGWQLLSSDVDLSEPLYNQKAEKFVLDVKKLSDISYDFDYDRNLMRYQNSRDQWQYFRYTGGEWVPGVPNEASDWLKEPDQAPYDAKNQEDQKPLFMTDIPYAKGTNWSKYTYLKEPDPPKETGIALIDYGITLGHINAHEYVERRIRNINRSDVNAVGLGQWVTFPICSNMNIAMRDVEFRESTEEAIFNEKRAFFPYRRKNKFSKLADSYNINNALKNTVTTQQYFHLPDWIFFKQEYFNRIYYSLIDTTTTEANEWKQIMSDHFVDYPKEYGSITKIIDNGNNAYIIFEHGIGSITVAPKQDGTIGLSPIQILDTTYGSMWKDSIISTDYGIFGVDTVAKAIWKLAGQDVSVVSTRTINKFLIDNIDLTEATKYPYIGRINVKTHYNKNKHDVIFTYYNDTPYQIPIGVKVSSINEQNQALDEKGNIIYIDDTPLILEPFVTTYNNDEQKWDRLEDADQIVWKTGKSWSICYNLEVGTFVTFYDWIPLESANIDNIFFSFDREGATNLHKEASVTESFDQYTKIIANKHDIDPAFNNITVYYQTPAIELISNKLHSHCRFYIRTNGANVNVQIKQNAEVYYNRNLELTSGQWCFICFDMPKQDTTQELQPLELTITSENNFDICDLTWCNLQTPDGFYIIEPNAEGIFSIDSYQMRSTDNQMLLWKHGQAGLYDNQGKIKPTHWYGKQHEFNFEFVARNESGLHGIFNNLKMIANKTQPNKFEYEIVGECYEWWPYKSVIYWANKKVEDRVFEDLTSAYSYILTHNVKDIRDVYVDFPKTELEYRAQLTNNPYQYKKLPYLEIQLSDKKGRKDKSYNLDCEDAWKEYRSVKDTLPRQYDHSFNTTETVIKYDEQLNEYRLHDEQLGNDINKYGRLRGNMQYLEDCWNVEIRPLNFQWGYIQEGQFKLKKISETRHRDKYIKIKVRYSGEDLALIQQIYTLYDESYA